MAISKVTLNGETLIDVTKDTVASDNLLIGKTATGADGEKVAGALTITDSAWIYKTASGNIATFYDGADDVPVKQLTVSIEPVQEGSGDPSAENVRPISGWTGAKVTLAGKNLFNKESYQKFNGYWNSSNAIVENASHTIVFIPCKPSTKYTIQRRRTADNERFAVGCTLAAPDNGVYVYNAAEAARYGTAGDLMRLTATTLPEAKYLVIWAWWGWSVNPEDAMMIEEGGTASAYEPFRGETHIISFPTESGTVYGGSLNITTGELTVTHGQLASYSGEALPGAWISDRDVYTAGTTPTTGAQVVYELAEPVIYQLTPEQVETLLGVNNIWADCGSVEVTYNADATIAYEHLDQETAKKSMLARVEDGMTATQNYTAGNLLIVEDTLYRVTAAIPNGGAITLGTNVTPTTMAAEIAAIGGGSGGSSITVDSALSATSENPVQNKVIKAALDDKDATSSVPASASVSNAGVLSFVNSAGTQLFTVQLPLYAGGVS